MSDIIKLRKNYVFKVKFRHVIVILDNNNNENMTKFEFENVIFYQLYEVRHEF